MFRRMIAALCGLACLTLAVPAIAHPGHGHRGHHRQQDTCTQTQLYPGGPIIITCTAGP